MNVEEFREVCNDKSTLEQLKVMSNEDLDTLSAYKVMGHNIRDSVGLSVVMWQPTTDMNDAMELVSETNGCLHLREHGEQGEWTAHFCVYPGSESHAETASRAITIASILAKEEEGH